MANATEFAALDSYLRRHFVPFDEFVALGGQSPARTAGLIDARAIPGPIYSTWPNGAYHSPVGGAQGGKPEGEPSHWYAPAAAWWLRRAGTLTPDAAAQAFAARFAADFVTRLGAEPQGALGYPQVYRHGTFEPAAAAEAAAGAAPCWP